MECTYEVECIYVKPELDIERSLVPEDSNLNMNISMFLLLCGKKTD